MLCGYGFNEIITYSFVSEKEYDLFGLNKNSEEHKFIKLINPIGEDMAIMRTSLLPSIVRAVSYNLNRKNNNGRMYELAKVYNPKDLPLKELPVEKQRLSIALFGENEDFFTIKGVVEGILDAFCCDVDVRYEKPECQYMHPTRSAKIILNNQYVGVFGQLHPVLAEKMGIDKPIYCGELFFDVIKSLFNDKIVFNQISKFPQVERDLAILVDDNVSWQSIVDCVKNSGGENLKKVTLFDIYQGNQVEAGKKSVAFNLVFSSLERTLVVEEIDNCIQGILKSLRDNLNAELR